MILRFQFMLWSFSCVIERAIVEYKKASRASRAYISLANIYLRRWQDSIVSRRSIHRFRLGAHRIRSRTHISIPVRRRERGNPQVRLVAWRVSCVAGKTPGGFETGFNFPKGDPRPRRVSQLSRYRLDERGNWECNSKRMRWERVGCRASRRQKE